MAGEANTLPLEWTDHAVTNSALIESGEVVTASIPIDGWVQSVELISGYGSVQTCAVAIVTATNYPGQAYVTVYSNLAVTSSVRVNVTNGLESSTTFLAGDVLKMYLWKSTGNSNCTIRARIRFWR
jgi:hypothetical protein